MPPALLFLTPLTFSLMGGFKCEATKLLLDNLLANLWLACGLKADLPCGWRLCFISVAS